MQRQAQQRLATLARHVSMKPAAWVMKNIDVVPGEEQAVQPRSLKNRTLFITGASRGIGLAIALRAARDGANVAIAAKTAEPHPKLEGTIYTAAKEIEAAGGRALPIICDVRSEEDVKKAIELTVKTFGGIDILVNNASAISLTNTPDTDMRRYDLMHSINTRGTFLCSKLALPHLMKSTNPHILTISPPLDMSTKWFAPHTAYTMAKYGMSMCCLGMAEEFKPHKVAVNCLWPRTTVATAAVQNLLGGDTLTRLSRTPDVMADSAWAIFTRKSDLCTGNFFLDDEVLASEGITDLRKYNVDPSVQQHELAADFFC